MIPHHGSRHNTSAPLLKLWRHFFAPDVFIIVAGNAKQHGHPAKANWDVLKQYKPTTLNWSVAEEAEPRIFVCTEKGKTRQASLHSSAQAGCIPV